VYKPIFPAKLFKIPEENDKCGVCNKKLRKSSLKRHVQYMHSGKIEQCLLCDYSTRNQSSLVNHILTNHLRVKKWKCMLCDFSAGENQRLTNHVKSVHLKEDDYKCQLCNETFSSIPSVDTRLSSKRAINSCLSNLVFLVLWFIWYCLLIHKMASFQSQSTYIQLSSKIS
jgi:hypothetical protein